MPIPVSTPLIWDTGVSYGLTTFRNKVVDYVESDIHVKYITKFNLVFNIGTTTNNFIDTNGAA